MGNCFTSCCKGSSSYEDITPDRDFMRRKQAEAAQKRLEEQQKRGIKNVEAVERQQRLALERERREEQAARNTQPTLKWQVN